MSDSTAHIAHVVSSFSIHETVFKYVGKHPVEATVWMPKALDASARSQPRPLCISYHGGGWVTDSRHSYEWLARWQVELMKRHGAIMVLPDYRLLPEGSGKDINEDIQDLVKWLPEGLPAIAAQEGLTVNFAIRWRLARVQAAGAPPNSAYSMAPAWPALHQQGKVQ